MIRKRVGSAGRSTWILRSFLGLVLCLLTQVYYVQSFNGLLAYPDLIVDTKDILDVSYSPAIWNGKVDGPKDGYANKAAIDSNLFHDALLSVSDSIEPGVRTRSLTSINTMDGHGITRYFLVIPAGYNKVAKEDLFQKLQSLCMTMDGILKENFIDDLKFPPALYYKLSLLFDDFSDYEMHLLEWFSVRGRTGDEFLFTYMKELHPDIDFFMDQPLKIYPSTDMKPEEIEVLDKLPDPEPMIVYGEALNEGNKELNIELRYDSPRVTPKDMRECEPYNGSYIREHSLARQIGSMWNKLDNYAINQQISRYSLRDTYRCRRTATRVITCGYNIKGRTPFRRGLVYLFDSGLAKLNENVCNIGGRMDARLFRYGYEEDVGNPDDLFSTVGHGTLMAGRVACSNVALFANRIYSLKVYSGNITDSSNDTYMYVSSYANAMYEVYKLCRDKSVTNVEHDGTVFLFGFTWLSGSSKYGNGHDVAMKKFTKAASEMCGATLIAPAQNPENAAYPNVIISRSIYPKKSTKGTKEFNACKAYPRVYSDPKYFHTVGSLGVKLMSVDTANSFEAYDNRPWPNNTHISECIKFYGRGEKSLTHLGGKELGHYVNARGSSMAAADIANFFAYWAEVFADPHWNNSEHNPDYVRDNALRSVKEKSILALKGTLTSYFNYPGIKLPPAIPGIRKDCMNAARYIYDQVIEKYPAHTYYFPYQTVI